MTPVTTIPAQLLPADGRFGSGPSKIRPEALAALAGRGASLMGTSHRQKPVKSLVAELQDGLRTLYSLPDDYQVVFGNGGSTYFWDVASFSLVDDVASFGVFGEFSSKFAQAVTKAPHTGTPHVTEVPAGGVTLPDAVPGADTYAWAHNETSTGACAPVHRIAGADADALMLIDATSAAGGIEADIASVDVYYFAPQKSFASDGGLWFAFCSPAAIERAERLASTRWMPDSLSLAVAIKNSAAHQTLNTPALATLFLMNEQVQWVLNSGGLSWAAARSKASSDHLYAWADAHELAQPFVAPEHRSPVVGTIDFDDSVDAAALCRTLRENGIVDVEPYRKLGRNQMRVGMFPSVETSDVQALTASVDWVLEHRSA